jgi:tetratricopeptide (TPR) repeat protein
MAAVRAVALLLLGGTALLGLRAAAEGPHAEGRAILREVSPLPPDRAAAARAALERSVALDPGAVAARVRAGEIALRTAALHPPAEARADGEAARAHFEAALALRPRDPLLLSNRALALAALGEDAPAEESWRAALTVAPWHRSALTGLGRFLARRGRAAEGLALLDRALEVDPVHPPALAARVEALEALGRREESLAAASEGVDRLLADPPRDLEGAAEVAERASAASEVLAEMLGAKAVRLLGGADGAGGRAVARGAAAGRPGPELFDRIARALGTAGAEEEALGWRLDARFLAAERALAAGDREAAAEEALRATRMNLSTETGRAVRLRAAGLLVRAGRREAALAEIGWAVDRGFSDAGALEADPSLAPLREDPAFRRLVDRARNHARRAEK